MLKVNIHDAKTHLSKLAEQAGAGEEIIIAKSGRPLARLVPLERDSVVRKKGLLNTDPLKAMVASVSVGIFQGTPVLDLDYAEDSTAETDMNFVMNESGGFIEIQGTAEGATFSLGEMQAMTALAQKGVAELIALQRAALVA